MQRALAGSSERAEGAIVGDPDGNRFLDAAAAIVAVVATGHSHPGGRSSRSRASCPPDPHVGHRLLLRKHGSASRKGKAIERRDQPRPLSHKPEPVLCVCGSLPRPDHGSLAVTAFKSTQKQRFFPMTPRAHHVPYAYCYCCAYGKTPALPQCRRCPRIGSEWNALRCCAIKSSKCASSAGCSCRAPAQNSIRLCPPLIITKGSSRLRRRHD